MLPKEFTPKTLALNIKLIILFQLVSFTSKINPAIAN